MTVSPDSRGSRSSEMRAFPHLIVRHDIERVPVQGEGHVPEDGAAILHHGHCLVQNPSLQRTVHSDLKRHKHKYRHEEAMNASLQDKVIELSFTFRRVTSVVCCISVRFARFIRKLPLSLQNTAVMTDDKDGMFSIR